MTWKYGMILVQIDPEDGEELYELVELYDMGGDEMTSPAFARARLMSSKELTMAYQDVQRDGVNRWFYDNGTFIWGRDEVIEPWAWDWTPHEEKE
jgi:hypothetical protein